VKLILDQLLVPTTSVRINQISYLCNDGPAVDRVLDLRLSPAGIQGSSQAMMLAPSPTLQTSTSFSRETPFSMLRRVCEIPGTLKKLVDNNQSKDGARQ
jgi:hypothetical protein